MKKTLVVACIYTALVSVSYGQDVAVKTVKKTENNFTETTAMPVKAPKPVNEDSLIKEKLVALAIANPAINVADANIKIAESGLQRAKSSWLNSIAVNGNVNEFVVNNSASANFFPKYNMGATIPFDIFSKSKYEKKVAVQNIAASKEMRKIKVRELKTMVLTRYEVYKEKKELVRLQKISMEHDNQAYAVAQKAYSDGTMELEEMDKVYQSYVNEQAKLVTIEKDYNIAVLEVEELIGVPLSEALSK